EAACEACGLCVSACPEQALKLERVRLVGSNEDLSRGWSVTHFAKSCYRTGAGRARTLGLLPDASGCGRPPGPHGSRGQVNQPRSRYLGDDLRCLPRTRGSRRWPCHCHVAEEAKRPNANCAAPNLP